MYQKHTKIRALLISLEFYVRARILSASLISGPLSLTGRGQSPLVFQAFEQPGGLEEADMAQIRGILSFDNAVGVDEVQHHPLLLNGIEAHLAQIGGLLPRSLIHLVARV
ncbi:hypothetical protein SAMN04487951_106232 [Vreelandella arcis]|uniref:Uncharacterized protein n=1 Tax=Vreelandella arcis TaxID=416873 RepID=A0A1H0CX68_9GAMM|nr:hypothetical protein SAMN04487951_106232 [Halomonas arcis]